MASSDDNPPHGKTKLIQKFTAAHFGPLNTSRELQSHIDNFRGGTYRVTTPVDDALVLYRLYGGGEAQALGQYWTVEPRKGNLGYQLDYAMHPRWNSLSESVKLHIPRGILLYEGYAGPQKSGSGSFGGGNWQVFVPRQVVEPLYKAQQAVAEGKQPSEVMKFLQEAMGTQASIMSQYNEQEKKHCEEDIKSFCTPQKAKELLKTGNALQHVPQNVRSMLQSDSPSSEVDLDQTTGGYVVHRQLIPLRNGKTATATLNVRLEFSHQTVTTNGRVTTITRYYNRIFEWA